MSFKIVRNDITKMTTEAIVNTANTDPVVGSGCDSAVYKAAGFDELLSWRKEKIGSVPEGEVFLTPGFALPAKYIIHAVSPLYRDGGQQEEEKLRSCYRKSLALAERHGIRSVAFPLIATGSFGYPREEGMRIAIDEIHAFLLTHEMEIVLVVFGESAVRMGRKIDPDLESYIDRNYVREKTEEEYGSYARRPGQADGQEAAGRYHLRPGHADRQETAHRPGTGLRPGSAGRPSGTFGQPSGSAPAPAAPAPDYAKAAPESAKTAPAPDWDLAQSAKAAPLPSARPPRRPHFPLPGWLKKDKKESEIPVSESEKIKESPAPSWSGSFSGASAPSEADDDLELSAGFSDAAYEELENRLNERMKHMSDTFSQYLLFLIREKGLENADVYKSAIVDKKVFSKIKNHPDYHPQKLTALCLCVGARLNLDETRDLLARAGYALSPCDKTDIIFSYFIENKIYDMIELDIRLEEHGLPCVIT